MTKYGPEFLRTIGLMSATLLANMDQEYAMEYPERALPFVVDQAFALMDEIANQVQTRETTP